MLPDRKAGRFAMTLTISSPVCGSVIALPAVPDRVFAEAIVGPGTAVDPGETATVTAIAPISGTLKVLKPHAYVVVTAAGQGVLVHLGIDTVELAGRGFELHAEAGDEVRIGDPLITWDTAPSREAGKSVIVPVILLDADADSLSVTDAAAVSAGEPLIAMQ